MSAFILVIAYLACGYMLLINAFDTSKSKTRAEHPNVYAVIVIFLWGPIFILSLVYETVSRFVKKEGK